MSGPRVVVLAGDGPAAAVTAAARDVLEASGCEVSTPEGEAIAACREAGAVLLGPDRDAAALTAALGLDVRLRSARVLRSLAERSPLRADRASRMDVLVVAPRAQPDAPEPLARAAFDAARRRRGHLTSLGPRDPVERVAAEYEDVVHEHAAPGHAAATLATAPAQLDVVLCDARSSEILGAMAAALTGIPRALPGALLGPGPGVFHPVAAHPVGAVLAAAMLLRHGLGMTEQAARLERALDAALASGLRTPDLATGAAGERPANALVLVSHILSGLRAA